MRDREGITLSSIEYYTRHAAAYVADTENASMHSLYAHFEPLIPDRGKILDAGCGSGRDALYFQSRGYDVVALEPCESLAVEAERRLGHPVARLSFQELEWHGVFDGIWACASLLHVPEAELGDVFFRLARALKLGGILYASFKFGTGEVIRNGRHFTNMDEPRLETLLQMERPFSILETWVSGDVRAGRQNELWLNCILSSQIA